MRRSLYATIAIAVLAIMPACGGPRPQVQQAPRTVIVHASVSLPAQAPTTIAKLPGVTWSRFSTSAMVNLVRVDGGAALKPRPIGSVLPFEIGAAEPLPDAADGVSAALAQGDAVISSASASLHSFAPGALLTLGLGRERVTVRIASIIDDPRTIEVEALIPLAAARRLGINDVRDIIAGVSGSGSNDFATRARAVAAPIPVRVGSHADVATPAGGELLSLAQIKQRFGEFTFIRRSGRWLTPDPAWEAANIVDVTIPVIGNVMCNRKIVPALEGAMRELTNAGLANLVTEPSSCYAPRVQVGDTGDISRHSWGIAIDINPSANGYGKPPAQDQRLVQIMQRWGFSWGGLWMIPDGMHFEYVGS